MFKKKNYLKQIYGVNPETNAFIIEVSLDDYNEIFNGWDPSPVKRRDLEPDLLHFLEECASDIPLRFPLELQFFLPKEQYDENKESLSRTGVQNNFNVSVHFIRREQKQIMERILICVVMAFAFLSVAYLSKKHYAANLLTSTLEEGLLVGGWVFFWEVFSLFFFSRNEANGRLKKYKRFQNSAINFIYK